MRRSNLLLLALLLHLAAPAPCAPPPAATLYNRSLEAGERFSYRGRQVTTDWRIGRSVAVLVSHRAPQQHRMDVLAPLHERGRVLCTSERDAWQFDPHAHILTHRRLPPNLDAVEDSAARYSLLQNNYGLSVSPAAQTVAGRKTFVVAITRKSNHLLARKIWIDAATGLVLRRETYREDGRMSAATAFSDVAFRVALPQSLFTLQTLIKRPGVRVQTLPPTGEKTLPLPAVRKQWSGTALAPANLRGFQLVSASVRGTGKTTRLHLRYSDGLILVSLFEQRRTQTRTPTRVSGAPRPVRVGGRDGHAGQRASVPFVNWDRDALNLTLVGEVSEPILLALATAADAAK